MGFTSVRLGLLGGKVQAVCDEVSITLNKNSIYGDRSAVAPGGVRLGTPALTTRGFKETDFEQVAEFLHRVIVLAKDIQQEVSTNGSKGMLEDFKKVMKTRPAELEAIRKDVNAFASKFPMPGWDVKTMKYNTI
jgi:glycine hydroxymethyltransferase